MSGTGCRACDEAIAGMSPMVVHTCRGAVQPDGAPSEPLDGFLPDIATGIIATRKLLEAAQQCCDACHASVSDKIRPYLFPARSPERGQR